MYTERGSYAKTKRQKGEEDEMGWGARDVGHGGREEDEGGSAASSSAPVGREFRDPEVVSKVL